MPGAFAHAPQPAAERKVPTCFRTVGWPHSSHPDLAAEQIIHHSQLGWYCVWHGSQTWADTKHVETNL